MLGSALPMASQGGSPILSPTQDEHWHSSSTGIGSDYPEHISHSRSRSNAQPTNPKRRSVFSGRSRSNTSLSSSTSTMPYPLPLSPTSSAESSFMDLSHNDRSTSSLGSSSSDKPEKSAKSFLSRGSRILRRQGSKFNIVATVSEEDEIHKLPQKSEVIDFFRSQRSKQTDANEELKRIISEPFDFHHLTHTSPAQFQGLDNTRANDLVTEFSVIRASQKPDTALKGIRADDIYVHNLPSDEWNQSDETLNRPMTSPTRSPKSHSTRDARPVENFSRPVSRLHRTPGSPTHIAPPRTSSRQAIYDLPTTTAQAIEELLGLSSLHNIPPPVPEKDHAVPALREPFNPVASSQSEVGHAVTTSEHYLDETEEEDDDGDATSTTPEATPTSYGSRKDSEQAEVAGALQSVERPEKDLPTPPIVDTSEIVDARPEIPPKHADHTIRTRVLEAPENLCTPSESLMSPTLPPVGVASREGHTSIFFDNLGKTISPEQATPPDELPISWEEDIDYCYEHAAESNCDFDWRRTSVGVPHVSVDAASPHLGPLNEQLDDCQPTLPSLPHLLQPLQTTTSPIGTPELEPSSAQSIGTDGVAAVTPLGDEDRSANYFMRQQPAERRAYMSPFVPQLITSAVSKDTQEALYEELLVATEDAERHFAFDTQGEVHTTEFTHSPRSSYSPISKYDSQESIILSRAASIVRKHRSSTSTNSVPELVPSLPSSRENTIRETIVYGDYPLVDPPPAVPELPRPSSASRHRQTKSLANELASGLRASRSSGSIDTMAMQAQTAALTHDRAKSVSAVHQESPKVDTQDEDLSFAVRMKSRSRPSRKSYSLFPVASSGR